MKIRDALCAVALLSAVVAAQVTVDFTADVTTGTNPVNVTFTPIVSSSSPILFWSFGDGAISTEPSPTHTYTAPGTYSVTLADGSAFPPASETKTAFIVVEAADLVPDFTVSATSGTNPATFEFTNLTTGVQPTAWSWDFGDGVSSAEEHPTHVYTAPGSYDVKLFALFGTQVESVTKADLLTVHPASLVPGFEVSERVGVSPHTVTFADTSTGVEPDSWSWSFGDGATSSEQIPSHTYSHAGSYEVTLELTFGEQIESITKPAVWVIETDFEPEFEVDASTGVNPLTVSFTDVTDIGADVAADGWLWVVGGLGLPTKTSGQQNPELTFTTPGVYDVVFRVDYGGVTKTARKPGFLVVEPAPVTVDFTADVTEGEVPLTVEFENLTTGDGVEEWWWQFAALTGAGFSKFEEHTTVTFEVPGTYRVMLTATIGEQTEQLRKPAYIHVRPRRLSASFTSDRRTGEVPLTIAFFGDSEGVEPTAYSWRFTHLDDDEGPAITSDLQNPEIDFDTPGYYTVEFTAWYEGQQEVERFELYLDLAPQPASYEVESHVASHGVSDDFDASEDFVVSGTSSWIVAYDTTNYALQEVVGADELGVTSVREWSIDGSRLIVGSPFPSPVGYVSIIDLTTGETLSQFTNPKGDPTIHFGDGVDLEGDLALVSALGFAYLYDVSDPSAPALLSKFKQSSDPWDWPFTDAVLHGDRALLSSRNDAAFLFDISDPTAPVELAALIDDMSVGGGEDHQIALNDEVALVGSEDAPVIVLDAQTGVVRGELVHPSPGLNPAFGIALAVSDDYAIVADAHQWHFGTSGVVYLFDAETLELAGRMAASDGESDEHFGWGLATVGDTLYAGAPYHDVAELVSGKLYRFDLPHNAVWSDAGGGSADDAPTLVGNGNLDPNSTTSLTLTNAPSSAPLFFVIGQSEMPVPFAGGVIVPVPDVRLGGYSTDAFGTLYLPTSVPTVIPPGTSLFIQAWVRDAEDGQNFVGSNAVRATVLGDLR